MFDSCTVDRLVFAIKCLLDSKDEIRSFLSLDVREGVAPLCSGNVNASVWLRPERTCRHPHLIGIRVVVVHEAANNDSAVGDIVNMWWRLEGVHGLEEEEA
jgi:hypothetical protein